MFANDISWWRSHFFSFLFFFGIMIFNKFARPRCFPCDHRRLDRRKQCSILDQPLFQPSGYRPVYTQHRATVHVGDHREKTPDTFYLKLETARRARLQNNMSMSYYFVDGYQVAPFNLTCNNCIYYYFGNARSFSINILFCDLLFLQSYLHFLFISILQIL